MLRVSDCFAKEEIEDMTLTAQLSKCEKSESLWRPEKEDSVYEHLSDEITSGDRKEQLQNCTVELKTELPIQTNQMLMNSTSMLQETISVMKFSRYKKLLRILVCVLIFIANCKGKTEEKGDNPSSSQLPDFRVTTGYPFEAVAIPFI